MDLFQALILATVEGVSEYLPISSTGHLVLTANLLGIFQSEFVKSFEIVIQLGAIMAVVVLYWKRLLAGVSIWKPLAFALVPTMAVGLVLYKFIKEVLIGNPMVTVVALGVGGVFIIGLEKYYKERGKNNVVIETMGWKKAILIGLGQSVSVIPGVSRAAATIFSGMLVGLKRADAVEFSFLLAVPTMAAATGLDLVKSSWSYSSSELEMLAAGCLGSFGVAIIVIRWLVGYVSKHDFVGFGVYRIVFSLIYWFLVIH